MPVISGKLKLSIGVKNYDGLYRRIKDFVENRLDGHSRLPLRFFFNKMDMQSAELPYGEEYIDSVTIPFNYITRERFSNQVQMDYDVRRDLSNAFRNMIPDAFDGVYGLEMNNDYDYFSNPPDFETSGCDYGFDYDSDSYSSDDDTFAGCRGSKRVPKSTPPPVEELAVIEKSSNTRKVFILRDEGV